MAGAALLFAAGAGLQAIGGIYNAFNAYSQGKAQSILYKAQANISRINAGILQEQYDFQMEQLDDEYRAKVAQITGTTIQSAAHSGLQLTGSVVENLNRSLENVGVEKAIQKYTIKSNYISQKYGSEQSALQSEYSAKVAKQEGKAALIGGFLTTTGTALESVAKYQDKWGSSQGKYRTTDDTGTASNGEKRG